MKRVALILAILAWPAFAAPSPQLTRFVANGLAMYGVPVAADDLTTQQAAALHHLLVTEKGYLNVRRKARAILRNPDFRD